MTFDHELKLRRAHKHLQDLDNEIRPWVEKKHYSVRYEYEPDTRWNGPIPPGLSHSPPGSTVLYLGGAVFPPGQPRIAPEGVAFGEGLLTAYVTAEQPPTDPISLLIGDVLHNLRSALDLLAFALANAYTKPLPKEIAESSEFPIFGDEDRKGVKGVGPSMFRRVTKAGNPAPGSGLSKVRGWHPDAQAVVERLQPYQRGDDFRDDPLWVVHDLDRISKHRLLHSTAAAFDGTLWDVLNTRNVRAVGPGLWESRGGPLGTDTPIGRVFGVHPIDPNSEVHMEIHPAIDIAFGDASASVKDEPLMPTLVTLYAYIGETVIPAFESFL